MQCFSLSLLILVVPVWCTAWTVWNQVAIFINFLCPVKQWFHWLSPQLGQCHTWETAASERKEPGQCASWDICDTHTHAACAIELQVHFVISHNAKSLAPKLSAYTQYSRNNWNWRCNNGAKTACHIQKHHIQVVSFMFEVVHACIEMDFLGLFCSEHLLSEQIRYCGKKTVCHVIVLAGVISRGNILFYDNDRHWLCRNQIGSCH